MQYVSAHNADPVTTLLLVETVRRIEWLEELTIRWVIFLIHAIDSKQKEDFENDNT